MAGYLPDKPGPQQPNKYVRVGPNYMKWGEIPGFIYDYSIDRYRRDPKVDQELGFTKKEPSLTDSLTPIAAIAGGTALATEGGKAIIPGIKGLLGSGAAKTASTAATDAALPAATTTTAAAEGAGAWGLPSLSGAGGVGAGPLALIGLATALGGRSAYKMLKGESKAWGKSSLADKAGRVILGNATGGLSEIANKFSGDKNRWTTEKDRISDLANQGYTGLPDYSNLTSGRSKEQLVNEAKATGGNVQFAQTRNEGTLTPQDIVGYASIIEKAGPQATIDQKLKLATDALAAGAVREHHGTIDVDWSKVNTKKPQEISQQTAKGLLGI